MIPHKIVSGLQRIAIRVAKTFNDVNEVRNANGKIRPPFR